MDIETKQSAWTVIDGTNGVAIYPDEISILEAIEDHGFQGIYSIEVEHGWAARYTMPGFLDCTEWVGVFQDEESAISTIEDMYSED